MYDIYNIASIYIKKNTHIPTKCKKKEININRGCMLEIFRMDKD